MAKAEDFYPDMDKGSQNSRIKYILESLLRSKGYVKIADLAEQLYVSGRQISTDLILVREYIAEHNLAIESLPHKGMRINGSEFDKRLCLADVYTKSPLYPLMSAIDVENAEESQKAIDVIRDTVSQMLAGRDIQIYDDSFENLVVHLWIAVLRIREGNTIDYDISEQMEKTPELLAAEEIVQKLGMRFHMHFSDYESNYIAIHLQGKRNYSEYSNNIPAEIGELVIEFLQRIDHVYHTSFQTDFSLCMLLNIHFAPLVKRIRYGLNQKNPLLDEIKAKYPREYGMACTGAEVINAK